MQKGEKMDEMMNLPDTWEEFEKSYGFTDNKEVYTNGLRLIPSFRVKQWLDHIAQFQIKRQAIKTSDCIYRQNAIDAMCSACGYDCDKSEFVYNAPQGEQIIMCPEHYALSTLPSAEPEQPTEIQDILTYLDEEVHPIVAPDNWKIYSELRDMISELSAQPEQINPCTICQEFDCYGCKFRRTT